VSQELEQLRPGIRIRDLAEEFQELQPLHDKINITLFVFSIFVCYQVAEEIADRDLKMPWPERGRACVCGRRHFHIFAVSGH